MGRSLPALPSMNSVDYRGNNRSLFAIIAARQRSRKVVDLIAARTFLPDASDEGAGENCCRKENFRERTFNAGITQEKYCRRKPAGDR